MSEFEDKLLALEIQTRESLKKMGVELCLKSLKRLCKSTSTVQGAIQYYFDNSELYETKDEVAASETKNKRQTWHKYIDTDQNEKVEVKNSSNKAEEVYEKFNELRVELRNMDFDDAQISDALGHNCKDLESALEFLCRDDNKPVKTTLSALNESKSDFNTHEEAIIDPERRSLITELLELGFAMNDASRACVNCRTLEHAIFYLTNNCNETGKSSECLLCRENIPYSSMYTLNCCRHHSYCIGCMVRHIASVLKKDESNSPHIPACPEANGREGCNHLMTERELDEVLYSAEQLTLAKDLDIGIPVEEIRDFSKIGKALYLAKTYRDMGYVRCVGCTGANEDGFWFELPEAAEGLNGTRQFVKCPCCEVEFCGRCRSRPYHFGCTCKEVLELSRKWLEWTESGREAYMSELAQQGAQYKVLLSQYQEGKEAFDKENRTVRQRYLELIENERWKEQHCKLCPGCDRVVEKIDGCDSMVCGRNYHGGDVQMGCGMQFSWLEAKAYVADAGQMRDVEDFVMVEPEPMDIMKKQSVRHMIFGKLSLRCDICDKDIIGPRINCVNCRCFNMCLGCSLTDGHSKDHCCQIFFEHMEKV